MEQETKTVVEFDEQVTPEEAADLVKRLVAKHPNYKGLGERGQQNLIEQLRKNPVQYWAVAEEIPKATSADIGNQISELQDIVRDATAAEESAWQTDTPHLFYTSAERETLKKKERTDKFLGWMLGKDHAETYELTLEGVVRERFKERTLNRFAQAEQSLEETAQTIERLYETQVDNLVEYKVDVENQLTHLNIAEDRLIEISGELEEQNKLLTSYVHAGNSNGVQEMREAIRETRKEAGCYKKSQRAAANNIHLRKRQIERARLELGYVAPLTDSLNDFHGEMSLANASLNLHTDGELAAINPKALAGMTAAYEDAQRILGILDEAFQKTSEAIVRSLPGSFTPEYEERGIDLKGPEISYAQKTSQRVSDAKRFGEEIRKIDVPYA